jgi:hypothetical protein
MGPGRHAETAHVVAAPDRFSLQDDERVAGELQRSEIHKRGP